VLYALAACQWVHIATAMLLFGGGTMREVFRRCDCGWTTRLDLRLSRALFAAAVAVLLSDCVWLLLEGGSMAGAWGGMIRTSVLGPVLTDTEFGRLWLARLPLIVATCVLAWRAGVSPVLTLLSVALLVSIALTGHAVMHNGWLGVMHPLNQAAHLLAAAIWLGGLLPLALVLAASRNLSTDRAPATRALRRFSDLAMIAVLVVLASGLVNAWLLVGAPSALIATAYGQTLLIKLVLVALLLATALVNRCVLLPSLASRGDRALARIERNVTVELVLGATVLAVACVLANLPPATM
jgi:putative copper resistance protein D